jgi:peptidoglycan/xylan/chitin deacetylase (PgdA/CDA1 family)
MQGRLIFGIDVETACDDAKGFAEYGAQLFNELECPVTWYLTGKTLEMFPEEFKAVDSGIERSGFIDIQAHTYGHVLFKTVLIKIPEGKTIHGKTDWYINEASPIEVVDEDLRRCQKVFEDVLGRRAIGLTTPWGYYRGLADRPDLLRIVDKHGFKVIRSFARDANDCNPVPFEWKPFFHDVQGFPHILDTMIHGYQDDYYWEYFGDHNVDKCYADYLKKVADRVARENLTWSMASHDHHCATREGFDKKGSWFREIINYAKGLGIEFQTVTDFYNEMCASRMK